MTLDAYYETKDKTIGPLFEYRHEDYDHDDRFDYYNADLLRALKLLGTRTWDGSGNILARYQVGRKQS